MITAEHTNRITYRGRVGINGCAELIVGDVVIFLHVLLTPTLNDSDTLPILNQH